MCEIKKRFNHKYRISSSRLPGWDYTKPGKYFVTICTEGKFDWLGKIVDGKIQLSEIGKIVDYEWKNTSRIRKNVKMGELIIMPNHVHGIVVIKYKVDVETSPKNEVFNRWDVSKNNISNKITLKSNSLGSIIGQIKSNCTRKIRSIGCSEFKWQTRYYDHIIRNKEEYFQIRNYIRNNPIRWEQKRRMNNL